MIGLFITGTDTGVGKTIVTAALARSLRAKGIRVGVCKPVATGAELRNGRWFSEDTFQLAKAAGVEHLYDRVTPWLFPDPAAPPVAAAKQKVVLRLDQMADAVHWWANQSDFILIEGVGGLLCPLTDHETVADLAKLLGFPLIIVARTTLGTLNHTLMTVEIADRRGLPIAGIILNEVHPPTESLAEQTTVQQLKQRIHVPLLATIRHRPAPAHGIFPELDAIDWLIVRA